MRNLIVVLSFLFVIPIQAQNDCSPYVPVSVGSKWEITNYSSKGKEEGKAAYELLERNETDSGTVFSIQSTVYDKKGNVAYDDKFQALCKDGQYKIDMSFRMAGMGMENYKDMDVDVNSTDLEIPGMSTGAGSQLKDATLNVKVSSSGMAVFNMMVNITDRKVEKKENKQTPAGSFECLVLYQKISTKTIVNTETYSREWYAEKVGMVRSESFNKSKKLMGYSELTNLEVK